MRSLIIGIVGSALLVGCSSQQAVRLQQTPSATIQRTSALRSSLDRIFGDTTVAQCFAGIKVVSLETDSVLYERNSNKLFHPASNLKLLTTATALHTLDRDFRFRTRLLIDSLVQNDTLHGSLYVKGFGDPLVQTTDLDSFARLVRHSGIRTILGDIAGDASYFDSISWGNGWMWDDEADPDEAFISSLTVNSNTVHVAVKPGRNNGKPLVVSVGTGMDCFRVENSGITSTDTAYPPLHINRRRGENTIVVTGRLSPSEPSRSFTFSVRNPDLYFLGVLKERLIANGVTVLGRTLLKPVGSFRELGEISHPLDSVLCRINKESDNIGAENLLKAMASEQLGPPGSATRGLILVKRYLASMRIDTSRILVVDGSGVSWYNVITPSDLVQLLRKEFSEKATFPRFLATLPIAGVDGTLRNQMIGTPAENNLRAKTGTLTGVSALSGYISSTDGKKLAFSLLTDHFPGRVSVLKEWQNKIAEILARCDTSLP